MAFFQDLGTIVETRWREKNYDDAVFPQIAADALAEHPPAGQIDPWELIRAIGGNYTLPIQNDVDGNFSNLPITLYAGVRFYIDIYFWLDGTTAIHQHSFAGAFQVLHGSSIHSHYSFAVDQVINADFAIGQLALKKVQLLAAGDVKQIIPGSDYIHSLFHLERPSATITIRTPGLPWAQPQFSYLKPYIAHNPFYREPTAIKKVQCVDLLLGMQHPTADTIIGEMLSNVDFHTAFMIIDIVNRHLSGSRMEKIFGVSRSAERFDKLLGIVRRRHGSLADCIPAVFAEHTRQVDLVERRRSITASEHRFFLALLLNVPGRKRILGLVQQRFPDKSPIETVLDWIEDLSATRVLGATESTVFAIDDFGDRHMVVLECLLKGQTLAQARKELRRIYALRNSNELESEVGAIHQSLLNSPILGPLVDNVVKG